MNASGQVTSTSSSASGSNAFNQFQEERFTRKKHDAAFPAKAVEYCLREAGITVDQIDIVSFYEKPFLKFERLLESYLAFAPAGLFSFLKSMPVWLKDKLWMKDLISKELDYHGKILFTEHHESHAASAFFPSPFEEAAFLTMDGVGEWATSSFGVGRQNKMEIMQEIRFPHSLGLLYSAFTYYTGFRVNSGEYKVMGLAPYGEPKYKDLILKELIDLREDGSFKLNMTYFNYAVGLTMTNAKFHRLFGGEPRKPESKLTQREMDLARSVQDVTEEVMLRMARHIRKTTGMKNLCLAGGVALNCVGNGKIAAAKIFDEIWIQPAAGDAGGAMGAALFVWYDYLDNKRQVKKGQDSLKGSYLGPEYSDEEIERSLKSHKAVYQKLDLKDVPEKVSDLIGQEMVVGWVQGRMEFGPRALGARSILGDARSPKMQEVMNVKIKFRESFRPFAPSVSESRAAQYFDLNQASPYMLLVAPVTQKMRVTMTPEQDKLFGIQKLNVPRSTIPAVTHVDYSARVQTVSRESNPVYHELLNKCDEKFNCAVIINTSFNVRGEPLVCTPEEAYICFMRTGRDALIVGRYLMIKKDQPALANDERWKKEFTLD